MSWKRAIANKFDNNLGRPLLARLATTRARWLLKDNVQIGYDGIWFHRVRSSEFVPDGPRFEYSDTTILTWPDEISRYLRDAAYFWFMHYQPRLDDVIIDIGAGRGEDTLAFARRVGPDGKVFAIEAHPSTYNLLRRFCELNQLNNVVPVDVAIMDAAGTVYIDDGDHWYANAVYASGNGRPTRATTLDQFCNEQGIDRIDFLKMNIEGSEIAALQGMEKTIERIRVICVCCHDFRADRGHEQRYRTREFVTQYLRKHGFSVTHRSSDWRDYVRDHVHGIRGSK